jgi:putative acetyltransferase
MIIREAGASDYPAIHALTEAAFGWDAEAHLIAALRESGDAVFDLVADLDGKIAGHVLLSALTAPPNALALAPVSVAPDHQRQGIGSALIHHGIGRAAAAGWSAIFLLGDPSYYTRFGFSLDAAETFETDYPREFFMALELNPDALKSMPKKVEYPAPFRELG